MTQLPQSPADPAKAARGDASPDAVTDPAGAPVTEAPAIRAPETPAPVIQAPGTQASGTAEPGTEALRTEARPTQAPEASAQRAGAKPEPEPGTGAGPAEAGAAGGLPRSHGRKAIRATYTPKPLEEGPPEMTGAWVARVVTLLPEAFPGLLGASLTGRALSEGLWHLETTDLRAFGEGRHRQVDDTPAGGGAGLVMRPDIIAKAVESALSGAPRDRGRWPLIYLSPRGKPFTQGMAESFSRTEGMTLLCGRFEGVDERVIEHFGMTELSIGDYVLTGGELAAQVVLDATVRLIPRVLGNAASHGEDSFSAGLLEYPQYTKPAVWQGREIPEVLLSGHHGKIAAWRQAESERLTRERRPDLWQAWSAAAGRKQQAGK